MKAIIEKSKLHAKKKQIFSKFVTPSQKLFAKGIPKQLPPLQTNNFTKTLSAVWSPTEGGPSMMMKFPSNKPVQATNGMFVNKKSMASTNSSSEEYSEDAHHNQVLQNKLSDSDSIISFMDCDEEGTRPFSYLC